ncbi:accessory regulator A [human gut metagenome]|uniref:Accessory regulator A n=1 Tax=human gut metagenome TaxID=408170 RepID=W1XYR1_9ZZZZ
MGFKIYGYDINREVSLMAISKINDCFELLAMVTYADRLKGIIKKEFSISFEEFAVLTYISGYRGADACIMVISRRCVLVKVKH